MTSTLADHCRRGAAEAEALRFRLGRVIAGYEQRPWSDDRTFTLDDLKVMESREDDLHVYLLGLAQELEKEGAGSDVRSLPARPTDDEIRSAA